MWEIIHLEYIHSPNMSLKKINLCSLARNLHEAPQTMNLHKAMLLFFPPRSCPFMSCSLSKKFPRGSLWEEFQSLKHCSRMEDMSLSYWEQEKPCWIILGHAVAKTQVLSRGTSGGQNSRSNPTLAPPPSPAPRIQRDKTPDNIFCFTLANVPVGHIPYFLQEQNHDLGYLVYWLRISGDISCLEDHVFPYLCISRKICLRWSIKFILLPSILQRCRVCVCVRALSRAPIWIQPRFSFITLSISSPHTHLDTYLSMVKEFYVSLKLRAIL